MLLTPALNQFSPAKKIKLLVYSLPFVAGSLMTAERIAERSIY